MPTRPFVHPPPCTLEPPATHQCCAPHRHGGLARRGDVRVLPPAAPAAGVGEAAQPDQGPQAPAVRARASPLHRVVVGVHAMRVDACTCVCARARAPPLHRVVVAMLVDACTCVCAHARAPPPHRVVVGVHAMRVDACTCDCARARAPSPHRVVVGVHACVCLYVCCVHAYVHVCVCACVLHLALCECWRFGCHTRPSPWGRHDPLGNPKHPAPLCKGQVEG